MPLVGHPLDVGWVEPSETQHSFIECQTTFFQHFPTSGCWVSHSFNPTYTEKPKSVKYLFWEALLFEMGT